MFCLRVIPSQSRKNVTSVKVNCQSVSSEWVHSKVLLQVQQWRGFIFVKMCTGRGVLMQDCCDKRYIAKSAEVFARNLSQLEV